MHFQLFWLCATLTAANASRLETITTKVITVQASNAIDHSVNFHLEPRELPSLRLLAIEPDCSTVTFPISSTCNVGVHTARKRQENGLGERSIQNKAIAPSCSTVYSSSKTCWAGAHPQPTFDGAALTITEITKAGPKSSVVTTTVVETAQISISAPPSKATGKNFAVIITPKLRDHIIEAANKYCPKRKREVKRDAIACAIPDSARAQLTSDVEGLISGGISQPSNDLLALLPQAAHDPIVFQNLMRAVAVTTIVGLLNEGITLSTDNQALPGLINSVVSSKTSTSTNSQHAALATPGPPLLDIPGPDQEDISILTNYLQSVLAAPITVSVLPPTSTSKSTIPQASVTKTFTQALPVLASPTCFNGGAAFRLSDIEDKVTSFCKSASKDKWTATQTNAVPSISNEFFAGQGQYRWKVPSSDEDTELYLQAKFRADACASGAPQEVDFKKDKGKWCIENFMNVLNDCQTKDQNPHPSPDDFWKKGGMIHQNCIEWQVGDAAA